MFQNDGNVLHFNAPKGELLRLGTIRRRRLTCSTPLSLVHAALSSNTLAVYGRGQTKELTELVPGILNQLGPDSLASLRKLAAQYQSQTQSVNAAAGGNGTTEANEGDDDDDDIPDLVDNFEQPEEKEKEQEQEKEKEPEPTNTMDDLN